METKNTMQLNEWMVQELHNTAAADICGGVAPRELKPVIDLPELINPGPTFPNPGVIVW